MQAERFGPFPPLGSAPAGDQRRLSSERPETDCAASRIPRLGRGQDGRMPSLTPTLPSGFLGLEANAEDWGRIVGGGLVAEDRMGKNRVAGGSGGRGSGALEDHQALWEYLVLYRPGRLHVPAPLSTTDSTWRHVGLTQGAQVTSFPVNPESAASENDLLFQKLFSFSIGSWSFCSFLKPGNSY